jgi:hypothetical protein
MIGGRRTKLARSRLLFARVSATTADAYGHRRERMTLLEKSHEQMSRDWPVTLILEALRKFGFLCTAWAQDTTGMHCMGTGYLLGQLRIVQRQYHRIKRK